MNTLLLEDEDFTSAQVAVIRGWRAEHMIATVGVSTGSVIRCGKIGGMLGQAIIRKRSAKQLVLECTLDTNPPSPSAIELVCALPRPKMLRRIVRTSAELGVKRLVFINSFRVEKSYWQSPMLAPDKLREFCIEGLQQAGDTVLPEVTAHKRFKPYVEDQLPGNIGSKQAILAHPRAPAFPPSAAPAACLLAVGPEGGFIDYEIDALQNAGFSAYRFSERVMRCDTVIPFLIARLTGN